MSRPPVRPVLVTAMLLVALSVWSGVASTPLAAQIPGQPGPGLGDSAGLPAGVPVSLTLPGGYTLQSLRGGFSEAYLRDCVFEEDAPRRPVCSAARGVFEVTLVMRFDPGAYVPGQDSNRGACRSGAAGEWSGWLLASEDGRGQNILLPAFTCVTANGGVTPVLEIPPPPTGAAAGSTVEFTLSGYCLNLSRDVPDEDYPYGTGVITSDPGLRLILAAIAGKNLYLSVSRSFIQDALWNYTDGDGLTQELLDELAALP